MSLGDFLNVRWKKMQAKSQIKPKEPWMKKYIQAIRLFPMDPVDEDAWINRIRTDKNLQRGLLTATGKPNDYTARFLESFYKWRLKPGFQYTYITYGRLGLGKTTWCAILAKMVQNLFAKAMNYVIMSYNEMIQAIAECTNHSILNFDEDVMPSGDESNNIKKYLMNESKFLRMKEINENLSYKKRTTNELCNAYFEMCGFNEATGESRTVMYDPNGACLGFVILKRNFDEAFFEPFKIAKEKAFQGLLDSGGMKPAFDNEEDEKFISLFFDVLQKKGLFIKEIAKLMAFIQNYASENKLAIFEPTIKRVAARLSVKIDEYILKAKKEQIPVAIAPEIISKIGDLLAADGTFKRMKSVNSIRNYIRVYCKDFVTPEQVNVAADLIYYKQKELHEISMAQTQEALKVISEGNNWVDEGVAEDIGFFKRVLKYLDRRIPQSEGQRGLWIETFKRKAQTESHDDVIKELGISHGTVTNYVTKIQEKYLGAAGEDAQDEELTEKGIPHLTQGKNSDLPDHLIFSQNQKIIEVWSQKTYLDWDFYKATHEVSPNEFAAAEANNCPLMLRGYECRGFKWHILRYNPPPKIGQTVNKSSMTSPNPGPAPQDPGTPTSPSPPTPAPPGASERGEVNAKAKQSHKKKDKRRRD
jgi:hypothetical protein